ncbi:2OG-Fe(II)-dependent halogenase WelO5 family protein [Oceanibacterium hippocampi]|uniref:Prolyl 4-hydroxylase alpha subunit Fe(2+) 2OG dioxygenase domain-containing protein n=1 Tax=Oceanibacterium hippocampi TaxID=745714 RepID=A0A1Y5TN57_9PROT|nr:hypothetical protein [Oceanibacterium hippocampi]SLN65805.1 hypothetical protein OCH7691_03020 [Oceanibacterium hippocampi]
MATWKDLQEQSLTRESLSALLGNEIPAIRIRNFATAAECELFSRAAKTGNVKYYSVKKKIGYIGQAQYEYRWNPDKSEYFEAVREARKDLHDVLSRSFDPVQRLMDRLRAVYPADVDVAREPGLGEYYAGIIRLASQGVDLHADFAPINTIDYSISSIDSQLGWNFFAEDPGAGGLTTVHNAPWNPERKPGEIPQSYGLDHAIVAGAPTFTYAPTAGDVVIFNTRNPHEVSAGEPGADETKDRVSIGSFIGRLPDRSLVLWA